MELKFLGTFLKNAIETKAMLNSSFSTISNLSLSEKENPIAHQSHFVVSSDISEFVFLISNWIHGSILAGENVRFKSEKDINDCFNSIINCLSDLNSTLDKLGNLLIARMEEFKSQSISFDNKVWTTFIGYIKGIIKEVDVFKKATELYQDLSLWTFEEIENFGKANRPYHSYYISRIIDFSKLEVELDNFKGDDLEFKYIQLNLILSEFDFHLKCSEKYIDDLITVYKYLDHIISEMTRLGHSANIPGILMSKCILLIKKTFARRSEFGGKFSYISVKDKRIKKRYVEDLDQENIYTHYDFFGELFKNRYKQNFNSTKELYDKQYTELQEGQKENKIKFPALHYLIKYVKKHKVKDIQTKIKEINGLQAVFLHLNNHRNDFEFDKFAFLSMEFLILKTQFRIYIDDLTKNLNRSLVQIERDIDQIEKIYLEINTWLKENPFINDFHHHKLLFNLKITLAKKFISETKEIHNKGVLSKDEIIENEKKLTNLSVLTDQISELSIIYLEKLTWCEKHNLLPLYLPYEECLCESKKQISYTLFFDSSYILCVDYKSEFEQLDISKNNLNIIVESLLIEYNRFNSYKLGDTEKDILKSSAEKTEKEIGNNTIKSVQFLGIFSGVISLAVLTFGGVKDLKDANLFLISLLALATIFFFFTGFIGIMSLSFDNPSDRKKRNYIIIATGVSLLLFISSFAIYKFNPRSSFNEMNNSVDSIRTKFHKLDSLENIQNINIKADSISRKRERSKG